MKKIFISHRSTDKKIADIFESFLTRCGINSSCIFCSSLPGNDIKQFISQEVKKNLQDSVVNIVILSQAYYESAYCQNEAGIIWFLENEKIIIALPDVHEYCMQGFLNNEHMLRRLDDKNDILTIIDILRPHFDIASLSAAKLNTNADKLILEYQTCPQETGLIYPDELGYYIIQVDEMFSYGPSQSTKQHIFYKIKGMLDLELDTSKDKSHWLCNWYGKVGTFRKGDKIKFQVSRTEFLDSIRHGNEELKNVRNITPKLDTIKKLS